MSRSSVSLICAIEVVVLVGVGFCFWVRYRKVRRMLVERWRGRRDTMVEAWFGRKASDVRGRIEDGT